MNTPIEALSKPWQTNNWGVCGLCGEKFHPGDLVRSVSIEGETRVVHEPCFVLTQELAKQLRLEGI